MTTLFVMHARAFRRATGTAGVLIWLLLGLVGRETALAAAPGQVDPAWQASFEKVWRTVKDKHFDTNFAGVDWDKVRVAYQARLETVKSAEELYGLLGAMLGELKQTHFGIVPPDAVPDAASGGSSEGEPGFDVTMMQGEAVVTRVQPRSSAALAGVRTGWVLESIDAVTVDRLLEPLNRSRMPHALKPLFRQRLIEARLNGAPGIPVRCEFLDGRDVRRKLALNRQKFAGEMSQPLGNFPAQPTEFESRRLRGGIVYLRFNIFMVSQMEKIRSAIRAARGARGLIIDLRGNPGGVAGMAMGMGGMLLDQQTSLGTMRMRSGHIHFAVFPQDRNYQGPLVILVDQRSASTSEIFAAGLQDLKRARVVGMPTAGAALPSMFEKLPTGALFQFAFGDFRTPKGVLVEGRGVIPDVKIEPRREDWLRGRDTQLDAAVEEVEAMIVDAKLRRSPID